MTELERVRLWWRCANYISAAELYLWDNALLQRPLEQRDIKRKLVGHWGTCPGQNFIYAHLQRLIRRHDLNALYVCGPGHGGAAVAANVWLEGSYSELYPSVSRDGEGLKRLVRQFSFPGGMQSHAAPELPGSIHEGGELGYSLSHAFGAVLDDPSLLAVCVVGDGEAETGPLAASWQIPRFLDREEDGRVLPILHLNGYKIANPTVLARIPQEELRQYLRGCGWTPLFVEAGGEQDSEEELASHARMAEALEQALRLLKRGKYPLVVLRSPKGWTGPRDAEDSFRSHQIPLDVHSADGLAALERWLRSYRPEELFTPAGAPIPELLELAPQGERRMGLNPRANGGRLLKALRLPDWREYAIPVEPHGSVEAEDMRVLGGYVRDVLELNRDQRNFRIFAPDETLSNRLNQVFEVTGRRWELPGKRQDEYLCPGGRVMDALLSEHFCEGALEGYLLTGRHGFLNSYEAFIRIVDSMAAQHAKWLKACAEIPWRQDIASLNFVLTSNVWQQDHNGFTHQDPGFLDHMANKKADVVRLYLPPDANTLLSTFDHCIRSRNYVNVIVASKHPRPQWLSVDAAMSHCTQGLGIWPWASTDRGGEPDLVLACCGDTPTLETLAAVTILREKLPALKLRVVNVVDLMRLQPAEEHPHGLTDARYDAIFTRDKPILFAFHGYPKLIHELCYRRHNQNLHVRGYKEEGTITTPFDMRVQNDLDRWHLCMDAVQLLPGLGNRGSYLLQEMQDKLCAHRAYIRQYGEDMPEVRDWHWQSLQGR